MIFDEELLTDKWLSDPDTHYRTLLLAGTPRWQARWSAMKLYLRNRFCGSKKAA